MRIEEAAAQMRAERLAAVRTEQPGWMGRFGGRPYRVTMRLMHRLGWCYPLAAPVEPGLVWCHWCGMRGRV